MVREEGTGTNVGGRYAMVGMSVLTFFPVYWLWGAWSLLTIYVLGIGR